jgi:hypothetical protein
LIIALSALNAIFVTGEVIVTYSLRLCPNKSRGVASNTARIAAVINIISTMYRITILQISLIGKPGRLISSP